MTCSPDRKRVEMSERGLPTISERVEKGIAWLEEQGAYDWAEKIVAAVEVRDFNLGRGCSCAVGTVLGDFDACFLIKRGEEIGREEAWAEAIRFGFWVDLESTTHRAEFGLLEAEWEGKARAHAAYRAEVLAPSRADERSEEGPDV